MPRISRKSRVVTIRLPLEVIEKIEIALDTPRNNNTSVNDYCKQVIMRFAFRHEKKES